MTQNTLTIGPPIFSDTTDISVATPGHRDDQEWNIEIGSDSEVILTHRNSRFITKTSAAALTIADPPLRYNGWILHIISTTPFAHTLDNSRCSGFNNGGNLATFAAAVGASISLIAYAGKWYVLNLNSVTLS